MCGVFLLYRSCSSPRHRWLLCIAHQQLEAGVPLLALPQYRCICKDTTRRVTIREDRLLIAPQEPEASNFGNHFGDAVVADACLVLHHICEADIIVVTLAFATAVTATPGSCGHRAGDWDSDLAAFDVMEGALADHSKSSVGSRGEAHGRVSNRDVDFEATNSSTSAITHVHHVQIENAHFQITGRLEDAARFGNKVAESCLRAS